MHISRKMALACGAAMIFVGPAAFAQDSAGTGDSGAREQGTEQAADIIVTAQKREERLQDVPLSITVVNGEQLEQQNVVQISELTRTTASLNDASAGGGGGFRIRGVGTSSFNRASEGSVGVVIDGVALVNAGDSNTGLALFDVARVEVLEGPQGLLFGRNSSAGIINITTNAPRFNSFEGRVMGQIDDRDGFQLRGLVNLPIADTLALRVSGSRTRQARTVYNEFNDQWDERDNWGVRGRLRWQPTSNLDINLIADYSKNEDDDNQAAVLTKVTPGGYLATQAAACGITIGPKNFRTCSAANEFNDTESYGFSGQIDLSIGDYTLTSITAKRYIDRIFNGSFDDTPAVLFDTNGGTERIRNFSQELRLTSPAGQFIEFVAGAYYFEGHSDPTVNQLFTDSDGTTTNFGTIDVFRGAFAPISAALAPFIGAGNASTFVTGVNRLNTFQSNRIRTKTRALFGQATINVTDQFKLIGGLRFNRDTIAVNTRSGPNVLSGNSPFASILQGIPSLAGFYINPTTFGTTLTNASTSLKTADNSVSFRVGAQYEFNSDLMAYATWTRGYKGPTVNTDPVDLSVVRPERPSNIEAGIKANLFDNRLAFNLAVFRNRVKDFQTQIFDPAAGTAGAFVFRNAPAITSKGISFTALGRPAQYVTINASAIYNRATYGSGTLVACAPSLGLPAATRCDAGGKQLSVTPRFKATLATEYRRPISGNIDGFLQVDAVYSSKIETFFSPAGDPGAEEEANATLGARIGIGNGDRWKVSAFVRNLTDNRVSLYNVPNIIPGGDINSYRAVRGPDSFRTFGATVEFGF